MSNSSEILKRRQFIATARNSPFWATVNLASFILCLIDYFYAFASSTLYLVFLEPLFSFFDLGLMLLFLVNFVYNVYLYIWIKKLMKPIELSANEFALFGINAKEIGFKLKAENAKTDNLTQTKNVNNYPSTPSFEFNNSSFIDKHSSLDSTALSTRLFDSTLDSTTASWSYVRPNDSPLLQNYQSKFNNSGSELKFRKSNSFLMNLSQNKSAISNQDDLKRYLNEQEERTEHINELLQAQKRFATVGDSSPMSPMNSLYAHKGDNSLNSPINTKTQSFGSPFNKSSQSPFMNQPQVNTPNAEPNKRTSIMIQESPNIIPDYQPAIKVSSLPRSPEKSETINFSHSSTKALEKVLLKLDVDDSRLNQMVENIRKWISQTILVRLAEEIESINSVIAEKNYIDSFIGETSIQQLKQLASSKKTDFPTLEQLCAFLDIQNRNIENNTSLQQYLVRRIKDLAKGGCITEFLWDGGGSYNYKHWKEEMLTDSEIILHLFCVYMDSRLLFNPTIPEGKPFTSQHFKSITGPTPKSDTYIQQEKAYPPFFSLVLKGENFDLPPGRNNLFYALLIFLHHIKVKNFGLLGRINLGASGLNIAWVIDK